MRLNFYTKYTIKTFFITMAIAVLLLLPTSTVLANGNRSDFTLSLNNQWLEKELVGSGDVHYYTFTVPQAGFVAIDYQGWSIGDSYIEVLNSDLTQSFDRREVWTSSNENPITYSKVYAFETGVYCIKINGYGSHTGKYRLKGQLTVSNTNEKEPNNSFQQAAPLNQNVRVTGFLSETDRVDFYRITVPSKQKFNIIYTSRLTGSSSECSLWDSDFRKITSVSAYFSAEDNPQTQILEETLNTGTYYIKIASTYGTGRYDLQWKIADPVKVKRISLSDWSEEIAVGNSFVLKASVSPDNAANKRVNWSSDNPKIASVSSSGKVTGKLPGKAVITATAADGSGAKETCTVYVKPKKMTKPTVKGGYHKVTAQWKKQKGIDGYEVQCSRNKSFWFATSKTKKGANAKNVTVKRLSNGKYYVRVRAYKKIGGRTYYGEWSSPKKVTVR